MTVGELMLILGIPTAATGFFIWLLKRHIDKRDAARAEADSKRQEFEYVVLQTVNAAISLAESVALVVQKIPNVPDDEGMKQAMAYAKEVKWKQKKFMDKQGIAHLHHDD